MKNMLLFSIALLASGLNSCTLTDAHIQEEIEKFLAQCSVPDLECDGQIGEGLNCGYTDFLIGPSCHRSLERSSRFTINLPGIVSFRGDGKASVNVTTESMVANHIHQPFSEDSGLCASTYINYKVSYKAVGELESEAGAAIMNFATGTYEDRLKRISSGERCAKVPHSLPLHCGG
jgi:hypothetical protein